jgi:hypothetical protein
MLATVLAEPFSRIVLAAAHGSVREMRETLRAYTMLWRNLPSLSRQVKTHCDPGVPPGHALEEEGALE